VQLVLHSDGLAGILQILHIFVQLLGNLGEHLHDLVVVRLVSECSFHADTLALFSATRRYYVLGNAQVGFTMGSAGPISD
jgi:hypothetical protein